MSWSLASRRACWSSRSGRACWPGLTATRSNSRLWLRRPPGSRLRARRMPPSGSPDQARLISERMGCHPHYSYLLWPNTSVLVSVAESIAHLPQTLLHPLGLPPTRK